MDDHVEATIRGFLLHVYDPERVRRWERVVTNYMVLLRIRAYWSEMGQFLQWVRRRGRLALE